MKIFAVRFALVLSVALFLMSGGAALSAPPKKKPAKTPAPTPADQLEAARTATKNLPALAAEATFQRGTFKIHLQVQEVGVDWELKMPGKEPMWLIHKNGDYFISTDEGKTWRPTRPDDDLVAAVMAPLENGKLVGDPPRRATFEALGTEPVGGEDLLHLRLVPDKTDKVDADGLPEDWLVSDGKGGWLLRRTKTAMALFQNVIYADIRYEALPPDAKIEAPEGSAAAKP